MIRKLNTLTQAALLCLGLFIFSTAFAAPQSLDGIVAEVNDSVITQSDLDQAMHAAKLQMQANQQSIPTREVLRKQILEQVINRKLQLQLAEQAGIKITDEALDSALNSIATQNHITQAQLLAKVSSEGIPADDYRKAIREELTLQKFQQQEIGAKITITAKEINDFTHSKAWLGQNNNEYHLEDILIALPEAPTPQQVAASRKHAEDVMEKLKKGISFKEAAMAESGDKNALQGGDLGWRKLPEIPSAFADKLLELKEKGLLGPILTPNGFHIVKLIGVRNTETSADKANQQKQVEQLIYQRKFEESLQSWTTKLRSEAFINIHTENA